MGIGIWNRNRLKFEAGNRIRYRNRQEFQAGIGIWYRYRPKFWYRYISSNFNPISYNSTLVVSKIGEIEDSVMIFTNIYCQFLKNSENVRFLEECKMENNLFLPEVENGRIRSLENHFFKHVT